MQGGTFDPRATGRRTSRAKCLACAAAGLLSALALIGGSLAALNHQVLSNDGWHRLDNRGSDSAVVLAPGSQPRRATTSDGTAATLDQPAPPALAPGAGVTVTPRVPARADKSARDGALAPRRRALPNPLGERAGASRGGIDQQAKAVRASHDSDDDGLTDTVETSLGTDAHRRDTDGDSLPDGWETQHGLNPTSLVDAVADGDGDGLQNRTEFQVLSDPRSPDTDANGMPDGEDDTDGDGLPNLVEQNTPGADPTNPDTNHDGVMDGATRPDGPPSITEVPAPGPAAAPVPAPDSAPAVAPEAAPAPPAPPAPAEPEPAATTP